MSGEPSAGGGVPLSRTRSEPSGTSSKRPAALPHVPALDGVRGIAVLIVLGAHSTLVFRPSLLRTAVPGGFLGVDVFFVLSGFLITSLLLNEQLRSSSRGIGYARFYQRRALRLLPALFALLLAHLIYTIVTGLPIGIEVRSIFAAVFYASNWVIVTGHTIAPGLPHLWSLAIEEQFYFVWPVLVGTVLGVRRSLGFTLSVLGAGVIVVLVWRAVLWKDGTNLFHIDYIYMRTDTRADAILLGAIAANLWVRRSLLPRKLMTALGWVGAAFVAVCVLFVPYWQGFYYKGGFTLVALATSLVILSVVEAPGVLAHALSARPLRGVGRVSYGLYLWHLPVFIAVHRYGSSWAALTQLVVALAITSAATWASWHFVETPFLRRKARLRMPDGAR